jgi:protein-S-isoprenylcysteine O-methyltransferase Ste14
MSLSVDNKPSFLAVVVGRIRRDLQFSRIFLVDFVACAAYAGVTLALLAVVDPTEAGVLALFLAAVGWIFFFVLKILVVVYLERRGGDAREFVGSETLVTSGLYAFSRNPVYVISLIQSLAWSLGLLGLGLGLGGHPFAFIACAAAPALLYGHWWGMDRLIVPNEEAALRRRHGPAFDAYCARVNRWLGRRRG